MALTNPKIFGLRIGNKLTDVEDRRLVLQNLGIREPDLDVIRGSVDAGASRGDFINFSRLIQPIFKTLDRYYEDTKTYESVVLDRAGISSILFGNLTINGRLDGNAMRYRYLDGTTVKIADISTSRVSAWSSSDDKAISTDPDEQAEARISYGAQVSIRSSGNESILDFGTQVTGTSAAGITNKPRLQTSQVASAREFSAEIPTHKIEIKTSATDTIKLFAMKGIPTVFEGKFRNTGGNNFTEIQVNTSGMDGIKPSWKVVEIENPNSFFNFANVLQTGNESRLNFRSSSAKNRFINFYYPPDKITAIYLRDILIETLPVTILEKLTLLNLENNDLKNMPDLKVFSPELRTLNLKRNNLHNSEFSDEKRFNDKILLKMPTTITSLTMGSTFYGPINDGTQTASILFGRFSNLKILNLQRYSNLQFFHKDGIDPECHIPNIPNTCTYYNIYRNGFQAIAGSDPVAKTSNASVNTTSSNNGRTYLSAPTPSSPPLDTDEKTIKNCTKLETLQLGRNVHLTDESFRIDSAEIKTLRMTFTNLPMPDLSNKLRLEIFEANHCRNLGHLAYNSGTAESPTELYKLNNCSALKTIYISHSTNLPSGKGTSPNGGLHGPFPETFTNENLEVLHLENTRLEGGVIGDNSTTEPLDPTIPNTLFQAFGNNLRDLRLTSSYFRRSTVGDQVFNFTPNLRILRIRSSKRIKGKLPNIGACSKLYYLDLYNNAFTGNAYTLSSNESLQTVYLHNNQLSGLIPAYDNLPVLLRLRVNSNNFTGLGKFTLPRIIDFRAHINQITGSIPTFADCPRIQDITLYSNRFNSYTPGAIAENSRLRLFNVEGNQLSSVSLNNIIIDLFKNYEDFGGNRRVVLNLRNQRGGAQPTGDDIIDKIDSLRSIGWTILT